MADPGSNKDLSNGGRSRTRAVIVGAGPAGAALGYLMARRGIEVVVLERQSDFAREFRGEGLMPTGTDALNQMGLGTQLDSLPHRLLAAIRLYVGKRGPYRIAPGDNDVDFGIRIVSQPGMLEMLAAEAARFGSFRLERGATVRDLIYRGDRVAGVKVESHSGSTEIHADIVIGADGRASVLRKRAGLHEERFPQAFDIVWGKVPLPDFVGDARTAFAYLGRGNAAICFPSYDGRLQIGWIINKGAFGKLRARGVEAWFEEMASVMPAEMATHLRANRAAITHPFVLDVICDRLVRWTAPGLLLIGDAAHPMSPVGAQGINMALRDAIVAANHLVPPLREKADAQAIDEAAQRVVAERLPEIEQIQRLQQDAPQILFGANWIGLLVRTILVPLLAYPAFGRRAFDALRSRFAHGITDVRLEV